MAAATTKRPSKSTTRKAPNTEATEQVEPANGTGPELTASYWQALDSHNGKGEIPAAKLDAVKAAYSTADPRKRANLVKSLTLQAADRIVNDAGEVDQGIALARKQLSAVLDEVRAETSRNERPPHDPVPDVAAILGALDKFRTDLVAMLTDDQRDQLPNVKVPDDDAKATEDRVSKALGRIRDHAINGRNGHSGPRAPVADVEARIRKAVHEADHPLTTGELAKLAGIPQATAYTRWTKTSTPGVKAIRDDKDRMVFVKDTDAA